MSNIQYVTGNILKLGNGPRILIHSCNCDGSWGGGIARQLAIKYPDAEHIYNKVCNENGSKLLGTALLVPVKEDKDLIIGCLFTSSLGGLGHDGETEILRYTELALKNLQGQITGSHTIEYSAELSPKNLQKYQLIMPKINSGIFGVPWEETEDVLEKFQDSMKFTVYKI